MSAGQYIVVYLPYSHLTPEAVGPFNSRANAESVVDRLDAAGREVDALSDHAPQAVLIRSVQSAIDQLNGDRE